MTELFSDYLIQFIYAIYEANVKRGRSVQHRLNQKTIVYN